MRSRAPLALIVLVASVPLASAQDAQAAKDPRNFDWVDEGVLAVGGGGLSSEDVDWLYDAGFRAIADLRMEYQDPEAEILAKNMTFLDLPIDSAANINATQFATFVAWAEEQVKAGRPVYVHCTNGWHRAAAFAVAWRLSQSDLSYDEAAREAVERRPGTVMRAVGGLLDYEAGLRGEKGLAVALVSNTTRPELNETMSAYVDVYADGAPAAGASVRVWSEESKLKIEGVTDAEGRFTFTYKAPAQAFMDHVYARASLDGYLNGADNIEFLFGQPAKARGPLEVATEVVGEDDVTVRITHAGKPIIARAIALAPGFTAVEATDTGGVTFRDLPRGVPVEIRAVSWGSEGGRATVTLEAPAPPPAVDPTPVQPPVVEPPVGEPVDPVVPSSSPPVLVDDAHGQELALRYAAGGVAGAVGLLALYAVISRRRSGTGSR